jgi:membrane-associated phospholipid phosphatase
VIYLSVARARPRISPSATRMSVPGKSSWDWHSFLSGHIANSMACAAFLGRRFSLGPLEPAMYVYVTAIGLGRLADGRHWASDTIAGAVMGFAIGTAIAERQEARNAARAASRAAPAAAQIPIIRWSITF